MTVNKVVLLACGSYNPPTNMHFRMFELARDYLHRLGICVVVGGIMSPVHDSYGKAELVPAKHRLAMLNLALQDNPWIKLSDWETKEETWTRTRKSLQYHQNLINSLMTNGNINDMNIWLPDNVKNDILSGPVQVKLLCGADLLESFATPGLWNEDDIATIVGEHGLVVITRSNSDPLKFIYNSDVLTKYMAKITVVTEWITNEVSSSKIRKALRRSESVKYLIPDKIIEYIHEHGLYDASGKIKYLTPDLLQLNRNTGYLLTPSPSDHINELSYSSSASPPSFFGSSLSPGLHHHYRHQHHLQIDVPDGNVVNKNAQNIKPHPGQAVKVQQQPQQVAVKKKDGKKEVRTHQKCSTAKSGGGGGGRTVVGLGLHEEMSAAAATLKNSKSCTELTRRIGAGDDGTVQVGVKGSKSNDHLLLAQRKSCDENLIKFIFTKHGIQVISDVETVV